MRDKPRYDERLRSLEHRAAAVAYKTTVALLFVSALVFFILEDFRAAGIIMVIYAAGSVPYLVILERGGHGRWWRQEISATAERRRRVLIRLGIGTVLGGAVYFALWHWIFGETLAASVRQTLVWVILSSGVQYWLMFKLRRERAPDEESL